MFSIMKYRQDGNEPLTVQTKRQANVTTGSRGSQHVACGNCRSAKLRCGGQKPHCDRCISKSIVCNYEAPSRRKSVPATKSRQCNTPPESLSNAANRPTNNIEELPSSLYPLDDSAVGINAVDDLCSGSENAQLSPCDTQLGQLAAIAEEFTNTSTLSTFENPDDLDLEIFGNEGATDCPMAIDSDIDMQWDSFLDTDHFTPSLSSSRFDLSADYVENAQQAVETALRKSSVTSRHDSVVESPSTHSDRLQLASDAAKASCQCWNAVLHTMEGIELDPDADKSTPASTLEYNLSLHRAAVEACCKVLTCESCKLSVDFLYMLYFIGDKLVGAFEGILRGYREQRQRRWRRDTSSVPGSFSKRMDFKLHFGHYEVTGLEWSYLFHMLLDIHSRRIQRFITISKSTALKERRDALPTMFLRLESRLKNCSIKTLRPT